MNHYDPQVAVTAVGQTSDQRCNRRAEPYPLHHESKYDGREANAQLESGTGGDQCLKPENALT